MRQWLWLWGVLLVEGTRALTSTGRWKAAYDHLQRHNGIGQRMLDGRQVALIVHVTTGEIERARTIIAEMARGEPWEEAVTACLAYLCAKAAGEPEEAFLDALLRSYRRLTPTPSLAVFHTRLGLAVIDAAGQLDRPEVRSLATDLVDQLSPSMTPTLHGNCWTTPARSPSSTPEARLGLPR